MNRREVLQSATGIAAAAFDPLAEHGMAEDAEVDLSPGKWPSGLRARVEQAEFRSTGWAPYTAQSFQSKTGIVSATVSPIAVEAGLQTLRQGGTAADAACTIALTQVCTQLGSVVSYAGIMSALYYDAKTKKISSLDGGWNGYLQENDPMSISPADLSLLTGGDPPAPPLDAGRQTLVPGFMAGIEALQAKFGRLDFGALFAPAIWYAEHGVPVTGVTEWYFDYRKAALSRTAEGRDFLHQAGDGMPQYGDVFMQPALAKTLRAVAKNGAREMYSGDWAKAFVAAVQRDGGKATLADLAAYKPIWSEPAHTRFCGHDVYVAGPPNHAAYQILTALNMVSALQLEKRGPYWQDPQMFRDLSRICLLTCAGPAVMEETEAFLIANNVDFSLPAQRSQEYATALASAMPFLFAAPPAPAPNHSNAIVVVDGEGNIAALTHTINTVIWGDTGIVVGGVPIPDPAGFLQRALDNLPPGGRVANAIIDSIVLDAGGKPVLATASIGSALMPETLRTIVSVIGQDQDLATVAAAPPLLLDLDTKSYALPLRKMPINIPLDVYDDGFIRKLKSLGVNGAELPGAMVAGIRGTVATVAMNDRSGEKRTVEVPGIMVWGGAES